MRKSQSRPCLNAVLCIDFAGEIGANGSYDAGESIIIAEENRATTDSAYSNTVDPKNTWTQGVAYDAGEKARPMMARPNDLRISKPPNRSSDWDRLAPVPQWKAFFWKDQSAFINDDSR